MNNISLRNISPYLNFKFCCQSCLSEKIVIRPIDVLYYKTSENINEFLEVNQKVYSLVEAIKLANYLLYECPKCGHHKVVRFDEDNMVHLNNWVKSNNIEVWTDLGRRNQ